MKTPIVFMFSGQGSQYYHMGKELFFSDPVFRRWMTRLDRFVSTNKGYSILDHLYNNKNLKFDWFDEILYTNPAIFMVEYSLASVLLENGVEPDYVLGASLGEFTAAAIAGAIDLEEALETLLIQADVLEKHCPRGGMLAIIDDYNIYFQTPYINERSELAALNYESHFVVSGSINNLIQVKNHLEMNGTLYQDLPVNFAFHSSLMEPVAPLFSEIFSRLSFRRPYVTILSCLTGDTVKTVAGEYFWDVVRQPIQFSKAIKKLEEIGCFKFIDLGPSGTLYNFTKRNVSPVSKSEFYTIITPFGQEIKNLDRAKELLLRKNQSKWGGN